jgi:plasmid maintenance system antidote protein VapI
MLNAAIDALRMPATADAALRLGRYFGIWPELWMNLQRSISLRPTTGWIRPREAA